MAGTALVTGASAGLGERFARALAKDGHDLILVARRRDRLDALAAEISAQQGRQVHVFAADLAAPGAVDALMAAIAAAGLPVNTLINNAGFGLRGGFTQLDRARQLEMIDLNCRVLVELCHAVLPGMVQMRAGGILNIASTAAFQPGPWMAVYYASKAFVLSFSEALHEEVKGQGVRVACLCPGATRTEFADVSDMASSRLFKMFAGDADAVVRDGLSALAGNRAVKVSGLVNQSMAASVRFTPRPLARWLAGALQKPDS
ncbi:SDR family oxidoreductase [Sphingomonas sp.]|uniref:SDR family NAD(P)-dependent oxidoreductase n=1 Tax=Sphingomonas sp. TaxID=28214 RepID=UPI001DB54453|nr:SDR family oxidoreductase [Sphingomonas sp.]MBX9796581.1 SDR family oxidoreductase [Sphingomonas sp.]